MKIKLILGLLIVLSGTINSCNKDPQQGAVCLYGNSCDPPDFRVIDEEPAWSPDGKTIAYVHGDITPGKTGIYLIDLETKENKLWHEGAQLGAPNWSPDGQWITFWQYRNIWKKKVDGTGLTQLTSGGSDFFPAFSPDGNLIAYDNTNCGTAVEPPPANGCGIFIIDQADNPLKHFSKGRMPEWLDNDNLLYVGLYGDLFKININTSIIEEVTFFSKQGFFSNRCPRFSPSNSKIAFTSQDIGKSQLPGIWVVNADGTNLKRLVPVQSYSCDWSPNGQQLVYTDARAINGHLWIMNTDGSDPQQLTFENQF